MVDLLISTMATLFIGLVTVPVMAFIKNFVAFIDDLAPSFQRVLVALIALGLTQLGAFVNVMLPTELVLVTADNLEAVIAAGIALAVHAGTKNR